MLLFASATSQLCTSGSMFVCSLFVFVNQSKMTTVSIALNLPSIINCHAVVVGGTVLLESLASIKTTERGYW